MADDIPFANGRGPAPRRRPYSAPFGSLQNDAGDVQFGNGTGPAPRQGGTNALAAQGINVIASPFGSVPTAGLTPEPPPPPNAGAPTPRVIAQPFGMLPTADLTSQPSVYDPAPTLAQERPPASPFGIAPPGSESQSQAGWRPRAAHD